MFVALLAANQAFGDVWLSVVLCYFSFQAAFSISLRQPENLIRSIKPFGVIPSGFAVLLCCNFAARRSLLLGAAMVFRLPLPLHWGSLKI